jgi:hypothetical protein
MTKRSVRKTPKLKKGPKALPAFETVDDAVAFFETHDTAPYLDQMEGGPEELALDRKLRARILRRARERLKKKLLTLRLENRQIEDARQIAAEKGMGYLTLMRVWIQEGIRREKMKAL